ncbi:flavonoid 3'-monooxygenase-like [Ananas comosus]|uniref:Flavonoid 3'-monooxygenase-like n=1 Tax=Ananas comosus TaxID=4615 RepID=A0A6P5G8Y9_ANACO|nr:flavonoid 3'-monooxygenase-like [Ananas comosus]
MDTLLLVFTLLLSSVLCYLFFFSKKRSGALRLPPGPKGWPILGNLLQLGPKPHHTLHALSKAHGPLFRLRFGFVDVVVASSAAVATEFLKVHDANFSNRPPNSGAEHTTYNYQLRPLASITSQHSTVRTSTSDELVLPPEMTYTTFHHHHTTTLWLLIPGSYPKPWRKHPLAETPPPTPSPAIPAVSARRRCCLVTRLILQDLFTAGTDTSTSTIEWAVAELIRHPKILKQAQVELDSIIGPARLVSESDLPNLPTLQAIIKESLRLHPSAPLSLPRMAAEGCEINGYCIPKQATLLVNIWAIGRDPAIWPDPLEFSPARFLPGGANESVDVKGSDFELIPFGAGRRICAGLSLGLRMVQLMTATLVHAFDWTLPDGQPSEKLDMEEAYGLTLQRAVPLVVRPVPRLLQKAYESIEK